MRAARGISVLLALLACISTARAEAIPPRTLAQECPLLGTSPLASARLVPLPAGTLLRTGSLTITAQDVDAEVAKASPELRAQLARNRLLVLEQLAVQRIITREANEWAQGKGRSAAETEAARVQAYLGDVTAGVTASDADLRRFFDENRDAFGGASFEQVKLQLSSYVLRQEREAAQGRFVNALSNRIEIELAEAWAKARYRESLDDPVGRARLSGRPSLVDFGAEGCVACDTMAPILALLSAELKDKANVLFVDVRKEQVLGARFGVRTIPLQVFFDREGKEVFRHVGVFPEAQIRAKLAELGVK